MTPESALATSIAACAIRIIRDTMEAGKIKLDNPGSGSKRYARYVPFLA